MLSPPSRMCSPTATRSSARSPAASDTAIRLKSVVPPPTSHTSTRSPMPHALAPGLALALEPGVEGGLRFLEQREPLEARVHRRAPRQLARLLVERRRHREHDVLVRERQAGRCRVPGAAEMRQVGGRHLHGRERLHVGRCLPGEDGRGPIDARRRTATTWPTPRAGRAPPPRASARVRRPPSGRGPRPPAPHPCPSDGRSAPRPTAAPGCPCGKSRSPATYRNDGSSGQARHLAGIDQLRDRARLRCARSPRPHSPSICASDELVVPRSMPMMSGLSSKGSLIPLPLLPVR